MGQLLQQLILPKIAEQKKIKFLYPDYELIKSVKNFIDNGISPKKLMRNNSDVHSWEGLISPNFGIQIYIRKCKFYFRLLWQGYSYCYSY